MIIPLLFATFISSLLLSLALLKRVLDVNGVATSLKAHRSRRPAVADLLNYGLGVDDGVIACKNGALLAAWEYKGEDIASLPDEQREVVSYRINQACQRLGGGWIWHVDCVRRPAPAYSNRDKSHFPDPISLAIDEERRRTFEARGNVFAAQFILTVSWMPPGRASRKLSEWMFDDDQPPPDQAAVAQHALARFHRDVKNLETRLSSVFRLRRLKSYRVKDPESGREVVYDELLEHLQRCITGIDQPVRLPRTPAPLDAVLGGQELETGIISRIGRKHIQVVAIEGFPSETYPGMLTALSQLTLDYRWSTRFIFLDSWEALHHLEMFRKKWAQQVIPFLAQLFKMQTRNSNRDAERMEEDALEAKAEVSSGHAAAGYYTSVIILMDEDREALEQAARDVEKAVNHLGFTARLETANAVDAYLGSLPSHGVENIRRPLVNSMNLADLLPVSSLWTGRPECPCPLYPPHSPPLAYAVTTGSAAFRLNLHVQDLGHTFIFGPTRMGKSTLLAFLITQLRRYPRMTIFAFDKGMSLYCLAKALGGRHYRVAGDDDRLSFCPLQYLDTTTDRAWALQWLINVLKLNKVDPDPAQQEELSRSLQNMHAQGHWTFSDLVMTLQDKDLRQAFLEYTVKGLMGHLFDAQEELMGGFGSLTVFETQELMALDDRFRLPVLWYLFRRIERSLHGQPAALILDEARGALAHPLFRDQIEVWLREMRKANCAVVMATQSLGDADRSGILDILHESTATKIFLPNPAAREKDASELYERFGLNPRQIELLATATPKREYYLVSEEGCRLFDLALGPLALSILTVSDKDSVATIQKLEALHGERWLDAWLERRGLSLQPDNLPQNNAPVLVSV